MSDGAWKNKVFKSSCINITITIIESFVFNNGNVKVINRIRDV